MASHVQLSNKQRRVKIETKWFEATAEQLFQTILDNLKLQPVAFLKKAQLRDLASSAVLSVVIVNNKEIQKLNKKWRQKDYPTDVLSFPLNLDAPSGGLPFEIGELIISAEKAVEQSQEYGHSLERELSFLFVHGCLHVLGFNHDTAAEEKDMTGRQKAILAQCKIVR